MGKLAQTDFSGGLFEAVSPGDFTDRQLPVVKGFVLENEVSLRSQPTCQRIGTLFNATSLRVFRGRTRTWLLALDAGSILYYCAAPAPTATAMDTRLLAWTAFPRVIQGARFLCEVPAGNDETSYKGGWLLNSLKGDGVALVVGENAAGTALTVLSEWDSRYPTQALSGTEVIPGVNVMPHAELGVMWGDYLILGRVRWYKNSASRSKALSASNTKEFNNALWVSAVPEKKAFDSGGEYQEFRIDQWSPNDVITGVIPAEATLLDLLVIEAGLLVFHTHGIHLLRGSAREPKPELLTELGGIAGGESLAPWPALGIATFIDARGSVWGTNGETPQRLDLYTRLGSPPPASASDSITAVGPYLLVARDNRLMLLRNFQQDGAWTELLHQASDRTENLAQPTQLCADGDCAYFLLEGKVWRYVFDSDDGRGQIDGAARTLTVGTPTWGSEDSQSRRGWFRAGVTATGVSDGAMLVSLACNAGPALAPERSWKTDLFRPLGRRAQAVVPAGIGPAHEASVTAVFAGDVRLESVFVETYGSTKVR